jgi:hypothetical protein
VGATLSGDGPGSVVSKLALSSLLAAAAAVLLMARRRRPQSTAWLTGAAVLLVLGDLLASGRGVNLLAPRSLLLHRPPLVDDLRTSGVGSRIYVVPHSSAWLSGQLVRGPREWHAEWRWALGLQEMLSPPIGARWGIAGSFDGDFTGLASPDLSILTRAVWTYEGHPLGLRLLQAGGVDFVLSLHEHAFSGLPEVAARRSVFASPLRLYRVRDPLPRTYAVTGVRVSTDPGSMSLLADPELDLEREVILAPPARPASVVASFRGSSRITRRLLDRVSIEAELSHPGYVVVLEAWDAGWTASVDGAPAEVLKANVLFRAVPVPAGRHRVELRYRSAAAAVGAGASLLAVVVGAAAAVRARCRQRPRAGGTARPSSFVG